MQSAETTSMKPRKSSQVCEGTTGDALWLNIHDSENWKPISTPSRYLTMKERYRQFIVPILIIAFIGGYSDITLLGGRPSTEKTTTACACATCCCRSDGARPGSCGMKEGSGSANVFRCSLRQAGCDSTTGQAILWLQFLSKDCSPAVASNCVQPTNVQTVVYPINLSRLLPGRTFYVFHPPRV
jgi:hypothetical protein